jgi:hypothetical protein
MKPCPFLLKTILKIKREFMEENESELDKRLRKHSNELVDEGLCSFEPGADVETDILWE